MDHDHSYKRLFSHPEMVSDLVREFVQEEWVREIDFSTLEKAGGSYVTDDLREREDDIIWRVRHKSNWIYIYLLLEFQSTIDRYMAIRLLVYVGLLYQDLIKGGLTGPDGLLPPVVPIVLYNGDRPWNAPQEVDSLVARISGLSRYRPRLRYLLLDEGSYADSELKPLQNLAAALFRIENSRTPEDVRHVIWDLAQWLTAPNQAPIRRDFTLWLKRVFLPGRMPRQGFSEIKDLQEVHSMLSERVKEWTKNWEEQGRQKGWLEGMEEGRKEGREVGMEQGRLEGKQEGEVLLLLRLLERRFGCLDETVREKVRQADVDTLLNWGERVLTAASLRDVIGD